MKSMKNSLLILFFLYLIQLDAAGQDLLENHSFSRDTIRTANQSYMRLWTGSLVSISNVTNSDRLMHFWYDVDGYTCYHPEAFMERNSYEKAVRLTFSKQQSRMMLRGLKSEDYFIMVMVDPKCNKILEVVFYYSYSVKEPEKKNPFAEVLLPKLETFEENIMKYVKCKIPEHNKNASYCVACKVYIRRYARFM